MSNIAILAGIVASDGHIEKNQKVIRIINKDLEFLEKTVIPLIKSLTKKEPKIKKLKSGFRKEKYVIAFSSPWLWHLFQNKYNIPKGKKSAIITSPKLSKNKEKIDFFRGWFAGDGCVTKDRNRPRLFIWSKSEFIIQWFKEILSENNIESKIWFSKLKGEFILGINKMDAIKTFQKKIIIPHPKKQEKLFLLLDS